MVCTRSESVGGRCAREKAGQIFGQYRNFNGRLSAAALLQHLVPRLHTRKNRHAGHGVYQLTFSIFALAIATCTSGASLSVTRMVAEGRGSPVCIRRCLLFSLGVSFSAAGVLWIGSDFLAQRFLDLSSGLPLRLLAPGLPFMAVCACLKGYFFAIRNSVVPAIAELMEQFTTIGTTIVFFWIFIPFQRAHARFHSGGSGFLRGGLPCVSHHDAQTAAQML